MERLRVACGHRVLWCSWQLNPRHWDLESCTKQLGHGVSQDFAETSVSSVAAHIHYIPQPFTLHRSLSRYRRGFQGASSIWAGSRRLLRTLVGGGRKGWHWHPKLREGR
ncbi:hypothetical protein Cadr_000004993 [Camelus dromedarius]|uniref:Uncharacterized protein n=1 Tax=Camelus dromedarius TaxID=9838 RepID=A0A5N4EAW7_CAMDR|nr:hypothetical protein Cadr_000004993 [Camelus dromedarius]